MSQQIILPELEAILIILTNTKEVGLFENTEKGLNKLNEKFTNYCINTLNNCNTQNFYYCKVAITGTCNVAT